MNRWEAAALVIAYIHKTTFDVDEKKCLIALVMDWVVESDRL